VAIAAAISAAPHAGPDSTAVTNTLTHDVGKAVACHHLAVPAHQDEFAHWRRHVLSSRDGGGVRPVCQRTAGIERARR